MYFLFFAAWVIFNGQWTTEIALFGIVISAVVYAFCCKFMEWSPQKDLFIAKRLLLFARYALLLVWEILKANWAMIGMTLSKEFEPDPVLCTVRTKLSSPEARTILANSITLTPGTITVSLEEDVLKVHCLDKTLAEGLENSVFEQLLLRIERTGGKK